jgi:hypothetical protein
MNKLVRIMFSVALLAAAPVLALARQGGGGGDGQWRNQGQFQRGQEYPRGREYPRGQEYQRGPEIYGRGGPPPGQGGYRAPEGRYGGQRYGPPEGGPVYAAPPPPPPPPPPQRRWQDSLGRGWSAPQDTVREGVRSGQLRPLGQVLPELRRRQPGRMLDTGIEDGPDGRPVYRVRWAAQDGRRMDFIVDARTGAVLATEGQ